MIPRPYQSKALDEIRRLILSDEKRILLQLSTGGGKTFVFSTILKGAHLKGTRAVMVVRSRALVDQASRRLAEMGVPHGVLMSNDKRYNLSLPIQICSVDTCRARNLYPEAKLVIIDEAHYAVSESFRNFLKNYNDAIWISVTATPWVREGLGHLANEVVYPISMQELIDQGFLVPAKYFVASQFDSSKIKTVNGEFQDASAMEAFEKQAIYGDVVDNYKKRCVGCTWIFAINLEHAARIKQEFSDAGIESIIIDGDTPIDSRKFLLDENELVISVGTLTTGVDVPRVKNIILCRPTRSRNLHVQILGRATRPYPGKEFFNCFDHVGNIARHGFIVDEQKVNLKEVEEAKKSSSSRNPAPKVKQCPECLAAVLTPLRGCPECNYKWEVAEIKHVPSEMVELKTDIKSRLQARAEYHLHDVWSMGYKMGAIWFRLNEEFDQDTLRKYYTVYRNAKKRFEEWSAGNSQPPCSFGARRFVMEKYHHEDLRAYD